MLPSTTRGRENFVLFLFLTRRRPPCDTPSTDSMEAFAMSRGYRQERYQQHGQAPEPLVWERVTWRQGDDRYVFEIEGGGLHAKLNSPYGTSLTLPMVAWEALLDAIIGARKARTRNERGFPARSGERWYDDEAGELVAGFRAGHGISQL